MLREEYMQSQVMQWFYKGPWILVSSFNTPFSFVSFKFKFQVYLQIIKISITPQKI